MHDRVVFATSDRRSRGIGLEVGQHCVIFTAP